MSRIETLLASMTFDEKVGQLNMLSAGFAVTGPVLAGDVTDAVRGGLTGSLINVFGRDATNDIQRVAVEESRLGIPLLLAFDVIHGHRTVFPIPLAEASSFDPDLWERTARIAAQEASADGVALTFAPMLDIARDPRWGRIAEGGGEDPLVASLYGAAKIKGLQGNSLASPSSVAATAKHFVAYGAAAAGRDYASTDVSERTLQEVYLPPFEVAVESGVAAVMPAFSDLSGVPMTSNGPLLEGWLRKRMSFSGVIVSDYNAIAELVVHGVAADLTEAAALALRAGVDIDMMSSAYTLGLPKALSRGLISMGDIETAVRRVLQLKERLGLFDAPFGRSAEISATLPARRETAREAGRRAIVLLKNDGDLLPLAPKSTRIALLGPLADAATDMMGSWSGAGRAEEVVTLLAGLREVPHLEIQYARGVGIDQEDDDGVERALGLAKSCDVIVLALGEARDMSGEAASRSGLDLPGDQANFARAVFALGKPTVVVLSSGRPLAVPWLFDQAGAVVASWFLGSEAGHAIADILTGKASPSGRLPVTWPRSVGQVPIFFGERPSGRPASDGQYTSKYQDLPTTPLFPFGYGLTYGRFTYAGIEADPTVAGEGDLITVSVRLRNDGRSTAEETVFLFIRKPVAHVARPLLELKAFTKLTLRPGEEGRVMQILPVEALRFPDPDLRPRIEAGEYQILVGPCADREQLLSTTIHISESGRG